MSVNDMKMLSHLDYPYVRPDLIIRLWIYKNRKEIVFNKLEVQVFGIVHTLTKTKKGITSSISPFFHNGKLFIPTGVQGLNHIP